MAPDFAGAAQAVADGCGAAVAAAGLPFGLEISRTDATPNSIFSSYQAAAERGASVIVGPMTRDGVTALARTTLAGPPTLMLNVPEADTPLPERFFVFGLSAESEARVAAHHAYAAGLRNAAVVSTATPLSKRVARAFAAEWASIGGLVAESIEAEPGPALKERMAGLSADTIFLSADAEQARSIRPYLNNQLPVYSVSLVHEGRGDPISGVDLNGIRFVDMPWLVQPDHPAVMIYPRHEALPFELQRFYALGIDACRLAPLIASRRGRVQLDGVTGQLRLNRGVIEREPIAATFRAGSAVPEGDPEPAR